MAEKLNLFINGKFVKSNTKNWINVLNPATQEVLCEAPCATDEEIEQAMDDLLDHKVDILTLGQYLRPTLNHLPVERWVTPEEFEKYREIGISKGFLEVVSGPMVRSSYRAEQALQKNNAGIELKTKTA